MSNGLIARVALASCSLFACSREDAVREASFELHSSAGCEVGSPRSLELIALGDFPSHHSRFDVRNGVDRFDALPDSTRELSIEGRFDSAESAGGRASLLSADSSSADELPRSILVLPDGRSCPLSDPALVAGEGAVVAPLPRGGLFIAGGTSSEGKVLSSALTLSAGELLGDLVPDGMLLRRRFASATVAGNWIVVAGGAEDGTYEVFDTTRGRFAGELSRKLSMARLEHGAALLPDGSVLLAGGRSEPEGAPLSTAELIRLEPPLPDQPNDLVEARVAPTLLVLDSGAVIVAAGRDASGTVVASLERFAAAGRRFVRLDTDLPTFESVAALALPGARVAWLGCDTVEHTCGLTIVLLRGAEPVQIDVPLDWQSLVPLGLSALHAVALDDGRILVTGRDPDPNMLSRALVIDLNAGSVEAIDASRAPAVLVSLADGPIAELDPFGTSLRRLGSFSMYDSPTGNLLDPERHRIAIDAPARWEHAHEGWRALVSGARIDVPHLAWSSFELRLRLDGVALVRIATADQPELSITVGARATGPSCPQLKAAGEVVLERRPGAIQLKVGDDSKPECTIPLPGSSPARLAIEAEPDAVLHDLEITRL